METASRPQVSTDGRENASGQPQTLATTGEAVRAGDILLRVEGLKMHFPVTGGGIIRRQVGAVRAVDGIDFYVKKGETLAGQKLESDFYGIVLEGIKGGTTFWVVWNAFIKNFGGDIFDAEGKPTVSRPENVAAVKFWADLWKFSPPGQAEYSLIDVPTVMGNGIAAQTLAWSVEDGRAWPERSPWRTPPCCSSSARPSRRCASTSPRSRSA